MSNARNLADIISGNYEIPAASLTNALPANWTASLSGTDMVFSYNETTVFKLTTAGAIVMLSDVTANGTP